MRIPDREFGLIVGPPAEFRFFTSAARKNDQPGDLIEDIGDELAELSPMEVSFGSGETSAEVVPVSFENGGHRNGCVAALVRGPRRAEVEAGVQCAGAGAGVSRDRHAGRQGPALRQVSRKAGNGCPAPGRTVEGSNAARAGDWPPRHRKRDNRDRMH